MKYDNLEFSNLESGESNESTETAIDLQPEDLERCCGSDDVFEANTRAEETEQTDEDRHLSDSIGASNTELKNLQHKLDVAEQNLAHAQKRLNVLLSDLDTPGNLIRDREYQIKVYEKEIEQLQREIKRELAKLDD